jgi:hypothetical protein
MKICKICNIEKELKDFRKSNYKDGYCPKCKECEYGHKPHNKLDVKERKCSCCKEVKAIELFGWNNAVKQIKASICKKCKNTMRHNKRMLNPVKEKARVKGNLLTLKYNITLTDYNTMLYIQDSKCLICKTYKEVLSVDHCHTTGKVRGLLCNHCNSMLGQAKDNIETLLAGIEYLKISKE